MFPERFIFDRQYSKRKDPPNRKQAKRKEPIPEGFRDRLSLQPGIFAWSVGKTDESLLLADAVDDGEHQTLDAVLRRAVRRDAQRVVLPSTVVTSLSMGMRLRRTASASSTMSMSWNRCATIWMLRPTSCAMMLNSRPTYSVNLRMLRLSSKNRMPIIVDDRKFVRSLVVSVSSSSFCSYSALTVQSSSLAVCSSSLVVSSSSLAACSSSLAACSSSLTVSRWRRARRGRRRRAHGCAFDRIEPKGR